MEKKTLEVIGKALVAAGEVLINGDIPKMRVVGEVKAATPAPEAKTEEKAEESKPAPKKKRTRKKAAPKKEEPKVEEPAEETEEAEESSEGKVYDKKYLLTLCKKKAVEHDKKYVLSIMTEYGANRMADLDPSKYEAFGKHLETGAAADSDDAGDDDEF